MRRIFSTVLFVVIASIDNVVLALLPAISPRIRAAFETSDQAVSLLISLNLVIVAITALFWGYRSDRGDRRWLLITGTLLWALPVALVPLTTSFGMLVAAMIVAGVGLGCISTVGYTIVTDLVAERWRGIMLGVWGLAQGLGTLVGTALVGVVASNDNWRTPFGMVALIGVACSALALLAVSPSKGQGDAALRTLAEHEITYNYRIRLADLPVVLRRRTNRWLMLQGFLAQFTYGSLTLVVVLLTAKLTTQGIGLALANGIAALFVALTQLSGVFSLGWGWLGDQLQQRSPRARALLAAYGFWLAAPFYLILFWAPLPLAPETATGTPIQVVGMQLARPGWWWIALLAAAVAVIAQATNAPNWYALVCEVNLPEQRGTTFSFITFANNIGRALGVAFVGSTFSWLEQTLPTPTNYVVGLSLFQLFFIPAGLCFWLAARSTPQDAATIRAIAQARVQQALHAAAPSHPATGIRTSES
jgi:MFS transporter, Spinster family, sphingosine-1-phosphate transporter